MSKARLETYAADPARFADDLTIQSARGQARFGDVMAPFQRERFAALWPAMMAVARGQKPPIGHHWWEATKGASKDSDLAVALVWLLRFCGRPLVCQVGAADADQADELRKAAKEILRLNPWIASTLTIQADRIINTRTGSACEIIAADVAGSHGARPDILILNELSHVTKREFAENLLDNAAKVPHGVVIIATNAGTVDTWQYNWRENARTSDRWFFHKMDRPSPWLDPADIDEAKKRNTASRFNRLWRGVWSSGEGDAIEPSDIDAAIRVDLRTPECAEPGWLYVAGLDIGLTRDASALVIVGKHVGYVEELPPPEPPPVPKPLAVLRALGLIEKNYLDASAEYAVKVIEATGKLRVCSCDFWQAGEESKRIDLESIERTILALHSRLHLAAVGFDPWQAAYLAERLRKAGIATVQTDFTPANLRSMATATLEAFSQRQIELPQHETLLADLRKLRIVEKSYGIRLQSPRGGETGTAHGDTATGLSIALHVAAMFAAGCGRNEIEGPLICSY